jgi:putative ABC transport system permease protein
MPTLNLFSLLAALGLMAIAISLSVWQKLGLEKNILVATLRASLQLLVLGYVLEAVFLLRDPIVIGVAIAVLLLTTTLLTRNRISQKLPRLLGMVGGSFAISLAFTLAYAYLFIFRSESEFALATNPQYWIPLVGIVLSSVMNGAAIAGEKFVSALNAGQAEIETHLSLGATPMQATAQYRRAAIRAGLLPMLNAMTILGMVSLPSLMGGQLLAGVNPVQAALYQIVLVCLMAIASLIAITVLLRGILQQSFNRAAQLILP